MDKLTWKVFPEGTKFDDCYSRETVTLHPTSPFHACRTPCATSSLQVFLPWKKKNTSCLGPPEVLHEYVNNVGAVLWRWKVLPGCLRVIPVSELWKCLMWLCVHIIFNGNSICKCETLFTFLPGKLNFQWSGRERKKKYISFAQIRYRLFQRSLKATWDHNLPRGFFLSCP